ncbi:pyridoxamine 5'-phosphate oxidase family protein [Streptosporangiaceae bacterium NEAU-GS5]|nr:pyridoxamine 5'-phosphate oxidase family protein [Streptosporangiaceae bacterium NEAU-GS5]
MTEQMVELRAMVQRVVDGNHYMALGTVEEDGLPRVSPVYFTHSGYRVFYWVSSPKARHSGNVARQPGVSMAIFDSSVLPGKSEAVYVTAVAEQVPDGELATECAVAFQVVGVGAKGFKPEELSGEAPLRLYRAAASGIAVHIRGSHPTLGTGIDARVPVDMEPPLRP